MFRALTTVALLFLTACASGSGIVTGAARPEISPALVRLYLEPPAEYEVIGLVEASSHHGFTGQQERDYAVEELRRQAGRMGANGILLEQSETHHGSVASVTNGTLTMVPTRIAAMQGRAIFVPGQ